jgi:uncharacterized protein GlcG (DUF336 family)
VSNVTLAQADTIIDTALGAGREHGFMALTVVVLDGGGHIVAVRREDGSGIMRFDVARGKAWGALGMGVPSRLLRDRLADRPTFQAALSVVSEGRFVPVPGGVLIRDDDDAVIGAVGVSGDTSDKDEYCAILGVRQAGLVCDPAELPEDWAASKL